MPPYKRDDLIRKIWWEKYLLPKKVEMDKCDVFLSLYQSATILQDNVSHIMVVHDIIPKIFPEYLNNWRKKIYQRLIEKAIKNVDKIIAVSHRTEKDLIQHLGIDAAKISVSHVDVDEIYKKEVSDEEIMNRKKILLKEAMETEDQVGAEQAELNSDPSSMDEDGYEIKEEPTIVTDPMDEHTHELFIKEFEDHYKVSTNENFGKYAFIPKEGKTSKNIAFMVELISKLI